MKEIDKKLIETISRYTASGIDQQVDYEKFYLYSLITHSTAIEGSTVTEVENQLLFDEGIAAKGRSLNEQMMTSMALNGRKQDNHTLLNFYANCLPKSCAVQVRNTPRWVAVLIPPKENCDAAM